MRLVELQANVCKWKPADINVEGGFDICKTDSWIFLGRPYETFQLCFPHPTLMVSVPKLNQK